VSALTVTASANQITPAKSQMHYTDTLPPLTAGQDPLGRAWYGVEPLNTLGRGAGVSNQVEVPTLPTLPPPENFQAQLTPEGVVLTWSGSTDTPEVPQISHHYRVYRQETGGGNETLVGAAPMEQGQVRMVDHTFEWEKTFLYWATIVSVVEQSGSPEIEVEGEDTARIRVFAHDIFPPSVPSGLQAVFSGAGQKPFVDLIWAPATEPDLAGYNVYRREEGTAATKINGEPVKPPSFRDGNVQSGKTYFYAVSSVDVRGNESARSEETSEAVP
jgi:hypothetical protein